MLCLSEAVFEVGVFSVAGGTSSGSISVNRGRMTGPRVSLIMRSSRGTRAP